MPQTKRSRRDAPGSRTSNTPPVDESAVRGMKVEQLREQLKEHGVGGTSGQRKAELVDSLVATLRAEAKQTRPARAGKVDRGSRSLRYAQEISSTSDRPERPGRTLFTTSHDVIQHWAEERDASPATVAGTEHDDHLGVLRFEFPAGGHSPRLRTVSWQDWFYTFDVRDLRFIYQEQRSDGRQSNFFQLENPHRENA